MVGELGVQGSRLRLSFLAALLILILQGAGCTLGFRDHGGPAPSPSPPCWEDSGDQDLARAPLIGLPAILT